MYICNVSASCRRQQKYLSARQEHLLIHQQQQHRSVCLAVPAVNRKCTRSWKNLQFPPPPPHVTHLLQLSIFKCVLKIIRTQHTVQD